MPSSSGAGSDSGVVAAIGCDGGVIGGIGCGGGVMGIGCGGVRLILVTQYYLVCASVAGVLVAARVGVCSCLREHATAYVSIWVYMYFRL